MNNQPFATRAYWMALCVPRCPLLSLDVSECAALSWEPLVTVGRGSAMAAVKNLYDERGMGFPESEIPR